MGSHYWVTEKDQSIKTKMVLMIGVTSLLSIFCITAAQNVGDSCEIAQDCYTEVCYYGKCQPDPTSGGNVGDSCDIAQDCNSGVCQYNRCQPDPTCGGKPGCSCDIAQDCVYEGCRYGICQAP